ncbi:MAG: ECF transporter S component [Oscillospiraceae bacterium]|nr:ECF transporter S component [Oscillospiraceae bacterium]
MAQSTPKTHSQIKNLTLAAMFLAIGLTLPLLIGQVQILGAALLPMHIPVLLCGLICGWKYGLGVGLILPIMRSLIFGMPPMFPVAYAMTFELAVYGLVIGLLYGKSRWQCIVALYRSLIIAMIAGRIVWGAAMFVLLVGIRGGTFTFYAFITGAVLNAWPGIVIQLILIPVLMVALNRTGLVHFYREKKEEVTLSE